MMSAAFDSSSESSDRFTYAMYVAGATYMVCDILEKYPQMQSLGGTRQDVWSEFLKSSKESIINSAFAAIGVVGTIALSQTSQEKAEDSDLYKQVPASLAAGVLSFLYLQSSKAIEGVSTEKRTQLHEREVAEPFEQKIKDTILTLSGNHAQAQNKDDLFQEIQDIANNKAAQLNSSESSLKQANTKITKLEQDIEEKDRKIFSLEQQINDLSIKNQNLSEQNKELSDDLLQKDQELAKLGNRKESWQERVSQGIGNRPRGNSI